MFRWNLMLRSLFGPRRLQSKNSRPRTPVKLHLEALEDRTHPSASPMNPQQIMFTASPPTTPQAAAILSFVDAMMEREAQLLAAIEQMAIGDYQVLSQELVHVEYSVQQQVGRILGINPTTPNPSPTASVPQPSSDMGAGRGNASGSGSGGGATTTVHNALNQALNNSTQQSGRGSGSGSIAKTIQAHAAQKELPRVHPLDGPSGSGPATVYGNVWLDSDYDGSPDNGELGYYGATVYLDVVNPDGSVSQGFSTTTDENGDYQLSIEEDPIGHDYEIQVQFPWSFFATKPGYSQINAEGYTDPFHVVAGDVVQKNAGISSMNVDITQDDANNQKIQDHVTLRDAIQTGNNGPPQPAITFYSAPNTPLDGTIALNGELDAIETSYNIVGPGSDSLTVDGQLYSGTIFTVNPGVISTISGLTIKDGSNGNGGGVINNGNLTLKSDIITANETTGQGGGIYNGAGSLKLSGDQILWNSAATGGGLYNAGGSVTITGGTVIKNNKAQGGAGGGIDNASGTVTAAGGTVINSNSAGGSGGGVANTGTFLMTGGQISQNNVLTGGNAGGGVYNPGTMRLLGVQVQGNSAVKGGGIYTSGKLVLGQNTSISGNNKASSNGAGIYVQGGTAAMVGGGVTNNTAQLGGGGIFVLKGQLIMSSGVLVSGNTAVGSNGSFGYGGGIYMYGTTGGGGGKVTVSGGTISNNTAAAKKGGGIFVLGGTLTLQDSVVITDNNASTQGGGCYLAGFTTTTFNDVIVSGNKTNGSQKTTGWGVYEQNNADVNFGAFGDGLTDEDDPNGNPVQGR